MYASPAHSLKESVSRIAFGIGLLAVLSLGSAVSWAGTVPGDVFDPNDGSARPPCPAPGLDAPDGGDDVVVGAGSGSPATPRGFMFWDGHGPWGGNVKALVADPTDNSRVLCAAGLSAARESGGVWQSTDNGETWIDTDLHGMPAYAIAASLSQPGVFYAAYYDGLYRSVDYGAHWTRIAFTAITIGVGVKADDGNVIIAGSSGGTGIKRSTDGGVTWQAGPITTYFMKGLGVSPADPNRMYLAMSGTGIPTSCYRSDDAGVTFSECGPATDGWGVWVDPANADRVILSTSAGIYLTTDGGVHWTLSLAGTSYANASVKDDVIYAGIVGVGVFESADWGATWTDCSSGITANFWYASGATAAGVLVGHYGGVYRTTGPGAPWVVSQTGLNNAFVRNIAYYADRGELWAATDQSGLWRSTDKGLTWELKSTGLNEWASYRLSPRDHEHHQGDRMFLTTSSGVYRSVDHGESWQLAGFDGTFMIGVLVDPGNPDRVWTGTATTQQIWRSEDGGDTWLQVGAGIAAGFYPNFNMGRNAVNGPRLFVNYEQMTNQIYYSDDLGVNFTAVTVGTTTNIPALTVRDSNPAMVFCGIDAGVRKSSDYGVTWAPGGLTNLVWSLLGTRTDDLYAGRNRTGVYVTHDDGVTWEALNTGIADQVIWDLCYGATTDELFCSPRGRGVKMLSLVDPSAVPVWGLETALATVPNPFHTEVTVRFGRPLTGELRIRVLDASGRQVRSDRMRGEGILEWSWDGRDQTGRELPRGTYYYEAEDDTGRWTGRCIALR